ncbi:uncharacterized protein LOC113470796 isoform X2 [Diaphorina citri]|uniref:Uncharacterized protein LOC113470796 isoform X2 n=1 Tax=Diaphorina citri TaxID=121845 RepID=A0A3Q0JF50_DIACI|nr:uncharacterized protein LOC113470796 isoform X2 [Diaphorina citri]
MFHMYLFQRKKTLADKMNNLPAAETSSNRPIRSTNVKNNFMSKFKDFVIPSSFKFPESKRQALQNSINLKSKSSPFKKSNSNLRSSHRSVHSTCENKTEGIIEMVNFKMNQSPRQSERDRNVGGYGYGSSPDLNSSRDNLFQASFTRDLNNSNDYTNKSRKSPDLDFNNDTVSTHLKKSAINLINEVTELLSTQSVKSCTINLSPDMSYDTGKHKDYNKDDMFVNSVPAHSQSSQNSEPKSGKLIVTDTDGSPDLYVTKHIKPNSADLFLSQASNVNDSPDLFPLSMISPEFPTCKSPDLFQRPQNSQNSCIESSQCNGEMIHASCSPFSSLISSINKGNIPSTQKPGLLPDPNLDESLDCSIIQCSQEDDGKKSHETPNAAPDKDLDCKLAQVFNQKRLLQDSFCPPNKKPKLKPTLVSPVEGVDVCEVFDAVKYLETRVIEQPHPHNTSFDPLLASGNSLFSLPLSKF